MKQAESAIPEGTVIDGKYRVEGVVGRGGMGTVYRAQHMALHEPVAIKILRRDAAADHEIVTRFLREGQLAVKLRSEHVARIHDISQTDDGLPYMVMELLEGADLGQLVEQYGALAAPIAVDLVLQSCDALVEAHSLGIVHRDIKPTNLFVSFRPDQTAIVKVLDFGISKSAGGTDLSLTQTQSMLGTPAYMSPEQMRSARDVDQRTDIWSLGTVLYELVEARRPFEAESFSEMCVMVAVDPPRAMKNAPELTGVIMRCLAKSPGQRYANVADLMAELAPFANNPDAARFYLTRARRVLGLPESSPLLRPFSQSLDSGPVATVTPPSIPIAHLTMRGPRALPAPTMSTTGNPDGPTRLDAPLVRSRKGIWIGTIVALLLGVGGAVAYVKVTDDSAAQETDDSAAQSPTSVVSEPDVTPPEVIAPVVDPSVDASIPTSEEGTGSAVDVAGVDTGSGSATQTATIEKPVKKPRKPPVKKPPTAPPPEVVKPPDEPPAKKCDPFDSRVKCK
ncbi:MAG: serine/threonine-protein kinase [Kofleriaceae bacterium]